MRRRWRLAPWNTAVRGLPDTGTARCALVIDVGALCRAAATTWPAHRQPPPH
jgi:hypothetical protein